MPLPPFQRPPELAKQPCEEATRSPTQNSLVRWDPARLPVQIRERQLKDRPTLRKARPQGDISLRSPDARAISGRVRGPAKHLRFLSKPAPVRIRSHDSQDRSGMSSAASELILGI